MKMFSRWFFWAVLAVLSGIGFGYFALWLPEAVRWINERIVGVA